jgi:hypothetical protein
MTIKGENRAIRRKSCPSVALLTTNPTRTALGANTRGLPRTYINIFCKRNSYIVGRS